MRIGLLRTVGAVTAVYGVVVARWPALLTVPSGLVGEDGGTPEAVRLTVRPLAWRDAVSGAALLASPPGAALRTAALVRIGSDLGDAALLGRALPGRWRRALAVGTAVGWAALTAFALLAPEPEPDGPPPC